eukprot:TRINITY_DN37820_c0_g2_i4.p1 TRINITY_DN37820_c0_g2~~TRINITY_DN37820_c0_g2_i4.p1  ORF type:complete len:1336 (+),score=203.46 TRINITY_DN37820_c0_g2_i4:392-4009(+)
MPAAELAKTMKRASSIVVPRGRSESTTITLLSCNVDSLRSEAAKPTRMRSQCLRMNVDIIAVQETHTSEDSYATKDYYVIASGATPSRQYGCELWIKKKIGTGDNKTVVRPCDFAVAARSPRYLMVSLSVPTMMDILVIYAPTKSRTEELDEFWPQVEDLIERHRRSQAALVILGDYNIEPASDGLHVGPLAAEPSQHSHHVESLLEKYQLFIPYSFREYNADGQMLPTFVRGEAETHIDHIAVPEQWRHFEPSGKRADWLDINKSGQGHVAIMLTATVPPPPAVLPQNRRKINYDVLAATAEENRHKLEKIFEELPHIPWSTEPSTHAEILNKALIARVEEEFPRRRFRPPPGWMSNELHEAIALKAENFTALLDAKKNGRCIAYLTCRRKGLSRTVRRLVNRDKALHIRKAHEKMNKHFDEGATREAYKMLKSLKPFKTKGITCVAGPDGNTISDPIAIEEEWQRRWRQKFSGCNINAEEVFNVIIQDDDDIGSEQAALIPSIDEIALTMKATRPGRVHGDDRLAPDLFRSAPLHAARAYHSLYTKVALLGHEPCQWRGGVQISIPNKGKWRGISLSDLTGKVWHRILRSKVVPLIQSNAPSLACGALPARGVEFAVHARLLTQHITMHEARNTAMLFVDFAAAFDSLDRAEIAAIIPEEHRALGKAITNTYEKTWLCTPYSDGIIQTKQGVRQGDPLSDIIFVGCMSNALKDVQRFVKERGLAFEIRYNKNKPMNCSAGREDEQAETISLIDVSYIDDVLIGIDSLSPATAIAEIIRVTQYIRERFQKIGLQMNFEKGKTELVFNITGKYSKRFKETLAFDHEARLDIGQGQHLRVVNCYRHLGVQHGARGSMPAIIATAIDKMKGAVREFAPMVFGPKRVDATAKKNAAEICISKALYASCTWLPLSTPQMRSLNIQYCKLIRYAAGLRFRGHDDVMFKNDELHCLGYLQMHSLLRLRRLAYLGRVHCKAPDELKALIQHSAQYSDGWMTMLIDDLTWLWQNESKVENLPNPSEDYDTWQQLMTDYPTQWKNILAGTKQKLIDADILDLQTGDTGDTVQATSGGCYCRRCDRWFTTRQGLNLHALLKHHRHAPARKWATAGGQCIICSTKFGNRLRLMRHLAQGMVKHASGSCLGQHALGNHPQLDEDERARLDEEDRKLIRANKRSGLADTHSDDPTIPGAGPLARVVQGPLEEDMYPFA